LKEFEEKLLEHSQTIKQLRNQIQISNENNRNYLDASSENETAVIDAEKMLNPVGKG